MTSRPPSRPGSPAKDAPLNPALKAGHDASYGSDQRGSDPLDTVSIKKDEGTAWPMIWIGATVLCVLVALVLLFG